MESLLKVVKVRLKNLARLILPVYKIEFDGMCIIYAGYSSLKKHYFAGLMIGKDYNSSYIGRMWYRRIPGLIIRNHYDIVICEISQFAIEYFKSLYGYIIAEWTTMRINIDRPLKEICHIKVSNFSDVLRRIRKYNMSYEVQSDKASFRYFYEKMYLPYISKRYGKEAWIEKMNEIMSLSPSLALITVKEEGIAVGASAFSISDGSIYLHRLGLLNGNDELRHHGVIGAIYYFAIVEGQKAGCKYLNVGGTRPFLKDGLTKFKLSLGAEFVTEYSPVKEFLWLGINDKSENARRFLENNQFVHVDKDFRLVRSST